MTRITLHSSQIALDFAAELWQKSNGKTIGTGKMYTRTQLISMGSGDLIKVAIDNGGTAEDAKGNRIKAVGRILDLIASNAENTATEEDDVTEQDSTAIENDSIRRPYGHGQLASIHWSKYRVSMTPKMYALVGAPKDPWGDEMLPINPAYFGADEDKSLENSYIGDQEPVKPAVEKGPPKKRGRRPGFKAPSNTENAAQTDIENAIAALNAELARRQGVEAG